MSDDRTPVMGSPVYHQRMTEARLEFEAWLQDDHRKRKLGRGGRGTSVAVGKRVRTGDPDAGRDDG